MQRRGQAMIDIATLNVATSETAQDEYEMYLKELEAGSKVTELERFDITQEEI